MNNQLTTKEARSERMKAARLALGLSGEAFGEPIGKTKSTISLWESGGSSFAFSDCLALQLAHGISAHWLFHGEGPMWASDIVREHPTPYSDPFLDRPLIVGMAGCGPDGEIQDPGPAATRYALRHDFASRILNRCGGGHEEDLYFLLCEGESMMPTILHKEIVLINTALSGRLSPRNNAIYLVRRSPASNEARVKRVRLDAERHQLVLSSDNRAYAPATIDLDGTPLHQVILGRVCWVGRYLLDTDPPEGDW